MPKLRRSDPSQPGITRHRRGRGFSYSWSRTGDRVDDPDTLERIEALVIPPAWTEVWICPWPHGHIQAVGVDAAGRRQYLYHEAWRKRRDAEKYRRAVQFAAVLPELRRRVSADLRGEDMSQRRVLAAAVRLLDIGCFRIGSETYARDHETFGIATLLRRHLTLDSDEMVFRYPAKHSVTRTISVRDPAVLAVLAPLRRRRGGTGHLLAWSGPDGWCDIHSADINRYLKETAGPDFSAKDFRTWSATVHAAVALASVDPVPASITARRRAVTAAVKQVAEYLGNTPAVCRSSYIDPRVLDHFERGETIADHGWPGRARGGEQLRDAAERALLALLADAAAAAA